jgi:hypothetical protein
LRGVIGILTASGLGIGFQIFSLIMVKNS